MSQEFKGFVARLGVKTGTKRDGSTWKAYSARIEKADGTEYDKWVSFGFSDPGIKEGDYIRVEANERDGRMEADVDTLKTSKNPPARAQKPQSTQRGNNGGGFRGGRGNGGGYKADGTGIQNRTNPEDAKRMTFANARSSAIELVNVLLTHDALPKTGAQTKAGQAARFEEVIAAVNKLTVQFHNDSLTLRLLETVADTVTDTKPDGVLPDKEKVSDDRAAGRTGSVDADDEFEDDGSDDDDDFE